MKIFLPLLLSLCFIPWARAADTDEQGPKDSPPSGLLAGVARVDITPPVGIAQMNWGSQTHVTTIGNDPVGMKATALVLTDGRQKFAMVDVDALFITHVTDAIDRAAKLTGIPPEHIRLGATHTHAGVAISAAKGPPGIDLEPLRAMVERYRGSLADQIVGVIVAANQNLEPAHVGSGRGAGTINVNRRFRSHGDDPPAVGRYPEGFNDRDLIVFRIDNARGEALAIIANYPCHGTVLAYANKHLSPDWPGMTRVVVEREFPTAKCLFFQGAAGNQGPIEGFVGDLAVAHRLGSILGNQISAIALQIDTVKREPAFEGFVESTAFQAKQHWRVKGPRDATLRFASRIIEVPRRTYSKEELSDMQARVERAEAQVRAAEAGGDPWKTHQAGARLRRFSDLLDQWKQPLDPKPLKVEVQALRIGEAALVAMPGEPFAEIGVAVRTASPFLNTMFCGYSDGEGGDYMPIGPEYSHGGYEVERTPYNPGADAQVIDAATALLRELR